MKLRTDQKVVCEVQGKLFELALANEYDGPAFIEAFMKKIKNSLIMKRCHDT